MTVPDGEHGISRRDERANGTTQHDLTQGFSTGAIVFHMLIDVWSTSIFVAVARAAKAGTTLLLPPVDMSRTSRSAFWTSDPCRMLYWIVANVQGSAALSPVNERLLTRPASRRFSETSARAVDV